MRIHLKTTSNNKCLPYNYQPLLTGALHKWIGKNNIHDDVSLYSFSWFYGGQANKNGLHFPYGAHFFISSYESSLLREIIRGIQKDPSIANGLSIKEVVVQKDPDFIDEGRFYCASPVFIKRFIENREIHFTFTDKESNKYLTDTLKNKLRIAGLSDEDVSVEFVKNYNSPKTKVIYYNKIGNRVNLCPLKIKGTPEQIAFAWNVGAGNSTGIGFGALK